MKILPHKQINKIYIYVIHKKIYYIRNSELIIKIL